MDVINSIMWLSFGIMIGWFANRMVTALVVRGEVKPILPPIDLSLEKKNPERYATPRLTTLPVSQQDEALKEQYFANDSLGG